jgi:hypothetical protein
MTLTSVFGLPQSLDQQSLKENCSIYPQESIQINGVMDIAKGFDIILFSAEKTLMLDGKTLPAGAVVVPALRKKGKKLAVFSLDETLSRDALTQQVNYLGMSFAPSRILLGNDVDDLTNLFPFAIKNRILMVCSDLMTEVTYGNQLGYTTLLIRPPHSDPCNKLGIDAHYVAMSV